LGLRLESTFLKLFLVFLAFCFHFPHVTLDFLSGKHSKLVW
jgi:hypothetical protein